MATRGMKSGTFFRLLNKLRSEFRQLLLLRRVYKNWLFIWLYEFTKHKRNVTQATLRSGHRVWAKRGHRFNNLIGLAYLIQDRWEIIQISEDYLILQDSKSSVRMKCRTNVGFDLSFLEFLFVEKIYRTGFWGKTVIDAGSYTGDSAVYFATNGATRVIGLEPYKDNLDLALENVNELNNLGSRITLLQAALSTNDGMTDFKVFEDEPNGNRIASYTDRPSTTIKAKTMTIDSIMREFGLERINVLKMNCEGAEYDIIESLTDKTAPLIDEIYVEFHRGPEMIIANLEKLGYKVYGEKRSNVRFGHLRALREMAHTLATSKDVA